MRVHIEGSAGPLRVGGVAKTWSERIRRNASVGSSTGRIGCRGGVENGSVVSLNSWGDDGAESSLSLFVNSVAVVCSTSSISVSLQSPLLSLSSSDEDNDEDDAQKFGMLIRLLERYRLTFYERRELVSIWREKHARQSWPVALLKGPTP